MGYTIVDAPNELQRGGGGGDQPRGDIIAKINVKGLLKQNYFADLGERGRVTNYSKQN